MGPAEPVRPTHSAPGSAALGAGKRAALAKRVVPVTRVASPPGISRSVGNKNSSESWVQWLMSLISTLWEAEAGGSEDQEIKTIMANTTFSLQKI
ncbi:hypothetical protein AAY473_025947 [Plecturocebus cupreus]